MKKVWNLIIGGAMLGVVGCSSHSEAVAPASETDVIRFGVSQSLSRAAFTEDPAGALCIGWEEDDAIGISATKNDTPIGANYEYRIDELLEEGAAANLAASSSQFTYRWSEAAAYTFYAYYPYSGAPNNTPHYLTQVSLPAEQPQAAANDFSHLQQWWVMKSEPCTIQGLQQTVQLSFRGVFSIVELKLRYATAASKSRVISGVQFSSQTNPLAITNGNLTLTSNKEAEKSEPAVIVNDGVNSIHVPLGRPTALSESETQSIWVLVAPGQHAAGELSVKLMSADSYHLDVTIPDAVNFEPNKVYRKEVVINPDDFYYYRDPSAPAVTYFKPVTTLEDITDGEYLLGFRYTKETPAIDYLIPVTPATRNPIVTDYATANVVTYLDLGILSADSHYVWTVTKGDKGFTFRGTAANGSPYYLLACDKAQGFSIATSLTEGVYNSYKGTYTDQLALTALDDGSGFRMQETATSARTSCLDAASATVRNLPTTEANGAVILYKKVTE